MPRFSCLQEMSAHRQREPQHSQGLGGGSCCLCLWKLFSQALGMGMSLAVLISCLSPGWCCCEGNPEFPPCSTPEKPLLLIHKLNNLALEHGANNLGLFPHVCQWLYQKDVLTLVQQVLDIAHRAVCAQTHVLDVGLLVFVVLSAVVGVVLGPLPTDVFSHGHVAPGLAPTGESLPVLQSHA